MHLDEVNAPLCVVLRGSTGLNGAVAGGVCVVVAAGTGIVAVGDAVAPVEGVVVGRTSAGIYHVDGDDDDQEEHSAGDYDHVESDTHASVGLLCRSSSPHRQDCKDKSGDAAGQADEQCAAADQSDDGEDESAYGHSRVILLWRRLASCRHLCTWMESMNNSPLCAVLRGSAGLNGAVAGRVCVVVGARIGIVAVGDAVGTVLGVVVGRTSAASADNVDGDDDDQEQHGAGDYDHVESDTDASVGLLCRSSGLQRHDGKDKSRDGAGQADERCAAVDKRDDGEHESGYRHSRVIFLRRRLIGGHH